MHTIITAVLSSTTNNKNNTNDNDNGSAPQRWSPSSLSNLKRKKQKHGEDIEDAV